MGSAPAKKKSVSKRAPAKLAAKKTPLKAVQKAKPKAQPKTKAKTQAKVKAKARPKAEAKTGSSKASKPQLKVVKNPVQKVATKPENLFARLLREKKERSAQHAQASQHGYGQGKAPLQDAHSVRFARFAGPRRRAS